MEDHDRLAWGGRDDFSSVEGAHGANVRREGEEVVVVDRIPLQSFRVDGDGSELEEEEAVVVVRDDGDDVACSKVVRDELVTIHANSWVPRNRQVGGGERGDADGTQSYGLQVFAFSWGERTAKPPVASFWWVVVRVARGVEDDSTSHRTAFPFGYRTVLSQVVGDRGACLLCMC